MREIGFEPVAPLRADPQVTTRFAMDPVIERDPVGDLVDPFPIPWQILAEMPVRFRAVIAKPSQDIDADFLGSGKFGMGLG